MDIGLVAAVFMLIVWAIGTFAYNAPGWIHVLLTVGMFLLIWRIAAVTAGRGTDKDGTDTTGR
jgi:uncharacterized membrane protein